jgi:hypothetical protein
MITKSFVYGFDAAIAGMRNALNSHHTMDSIHHGSKHYIIGAKDLALACKLISASRSERKFLRAIHIWWDITLPRYIWTEFDTYKVATVRLSASTMHKLGSRDLTPDDFADRNIQQGVLESLNSLGAQYREATGITKVAILRNMKQQLPEGYLQFATVNFNYETAIAMYHDRKNHRMAEWSGVGGICESIKNLPFMTEFIAASSKGKS